MTREEVIQEFQNVKDLIRQDGKDWLDERDLELIDMAIEALKQQSDEMQLLNDGTLKVKVANVLDIKRVMVMDNNVIYDSYYPDRPSGEWKRLIEYVPESDEGLINFDGYQCSACGGKVWVGDFEFWDYCPNCGAIMENKD